MKKTRVLIVEDQRIVAEDIKRTLLDMEYDVTSIESSGEDAVNAAQKDNPDLVLMDILLNGEINGIEAADRIRTRSEIPIVYLTAYADEETLQQVKTTEPFGYIIKPFENKELRTTIEVALYKSRMEKKIRHLNTVLSNIHKVHRILTREKDPDLVLKATCNTLIKNRGYYFIWIVILDESGKPINTAEAGLGKKFLQVVERMRHGLLPECGRKALSQPGFVITEDPLNSCADCPLAHYHQAESSMTSRLEYGNKIFGIITVAISQDFIPEEEEQSLFKSFTSEFSFYLHGIDLELKRRTAVKELQESEEKFRTIVETAPGLLQITDMEGNNIYVSPNCEKITGYTQEELIEEPRFWVHEDDMPREMEMYNRAYKKMEADSNFEYKAVKKNGELWYASSSWVVLKDKDGINKGVVLQTTDITNRKRAEIALNESRKLFSTLAGVSPVGIFHTDTEGVCRYVNNVFCKIAGISAKEAELKGWSWTLHPEDREKVTRKWDKAAGSGSMFKSEFRFQNRDGRATWVFGQAVAEKDTNNETIGYIGTITDINDLKRTENELKKSRLTLIKQKASLENKNVALREIIGQVEIEKNKIKDNIIININEVVIPILEKMKINNDTDSYIDILEHYLGKLASSFGRNIIKRGNKLTPREMEISMLIESGLTNKEISKLLNISCQTVENHRKNIRNKLKITNKNINLATFLRQLES